MKQNEIEYFDIPTSLKRKRAPARSSFLASCLFVGAGAGAGAVALRVYLDGGAYGLQLIEYIGAYGITGLILGVLLYVILRII